jgi:uncharacterized protein
MQQVVPKTQTCVYTVCCGAGGGRLRQWHNPQLVELTVIHGDDATPGRKSPAISAATVTGISGATIKAGFYFPKWSSCAGVAKNEGLLI